MCVVDVGEDPTSVEFNRVNLPPGGLRRKNSMTPQMASSPNMPEEVDCPELVELALVDVDDEVLLLIDVPGSISGVAKKIQWVRRFVRWGILFAYHRQ